jgi:GT2 family glycosyltransferase/glycosyltransferase involved in cell wall biosynthesis
MNHNHPGKASIIILTRNGLEFTRQCLESIFAKTTYPDYEIIVVDNASQDGTLEYLDEISARQKNVQIISNKQNEGFARGNNQGARAAKGEYLVFLNNDTVVTHGWLTRLIEHLQDPSIGLIGPVTNSASNEAKISVTYEAIDDLDSFTQEYTQAHYGEAFDIRALAFFCVALRTERFQEIGPLEESFGLGMFEDDDYAIRVKNSGYKVVCTEDVFVHHWGGASFLKLDPYQYWLLFKENRKKFEEKWEVTWQPHLQRTELLPDQVIKLNEQVYQLQWQLLSDSRIETTDASFSIVVDRLIEQDQSLVEKGQEIERLSTTLEEIYTSNGWKIVQLIWIVKQALFPEGSSHEGILSRVMNIGKLLLKGTPPRKPPIMQTQTFSSTSQEMKDELRVERITQQIAILAPQFFDLQGQSVFIGGAERYMIELIKIIRELGQEPVVYQSAIGEWEREYQGIPFFGLNSNGDNKKLNVKFHSLINKNTPVIYLAFNLAAPYHSNRSIGISHGVFWDHQKHDYSEERERLVDFLMASFSNLSRIVSVDTNTINWLRTLKPSLAEKCVYIPNFVDGDKFKPVNRSRQDKLVVLYPRRLYTPRGYWLVHELVPEFLNSYLELEFHFVGQADPEEQTSVKKLIRNYPGRVYWKTLEMQTMHEAYAEADITLIPSVYSEGTSLSCLEAMASGNAVIATNIGGLPDLVISGYNGLLIEPSASALREALSTLCENPDMRRQLGRRAHQVAGAFNIEAWQSKWRKILTEVFL